MLKVAIVGCGKIADDHATQILRLKGCEIVGACDREQLMAQQLCDRFPIKRCFADLADLLDECRPDVVHVTTPPNTHFEVARFCLEHGCHVYVEKPFTLNRVDAQHLIELATRKNLKITVGHDYQFNPAARRMRRLVSEGFLGSRPLHMESYYDYSFGRSGYAGAFLGDRQHWVRQLPGKLLQNVISHGIARIAEYLQGDSPKVLAYGFVSPALERMGESEMIDELRVIIADENQTTAYFTFSSQVLTIFHRFCVYGQRNGLGLSQNGETLIKFRGGAERFASRIFPSMQKLDNARATLAGLMARDLYPQAGMRHLIDLFYRSVRGEAQVPIPYREIMLTGKIMDSIFEQVGNRQPLAQAACGN